MKNKEREKKGDDNVDREKLRTAFTVFVITVVILFSAMVILLAMLQYDFDKAEARFTEDFTFSSPIELWDRVPNLSIYPWSQYHKYSTRELSQEQIEFLQGKRVAECMVDMVNYDDILINDKESAVSLLYTNARRLLTDDDKEYYVWNQLQVEGVYLFGMVNMSGEIFSFHYVTDMEYDEQEAIEYVRNSFEDGQKYYSFDHNFNDFECNRKLFVETIRKKLEEYQNLDTTIFYKNIDLRKKPTINEENGNAILIYVSETKEDYFVFLYLDCKTKKVSGYHLMLY